MTIYQSEKALPYVYIGIHKETGQFYIGSRTTKKLKTPEGHHYVIYSPNDITYYSTNLRKFCRDNNLSQSAMSAVSTNKYNNYKGWKCVKLK